MNINRTAWLGAATLAVLATTASAQIVNTKHNFSSMAWSGGEICKPCHTPHFAMKEAGALWNHELTTATYLMWEGEGTAETDLDKRSRLCLSCHDGTVALDSFGGMTGSSFITATANMGLDLEDDHPIGRDAVYPVEGSTRFNPANTLPSTMRLRDWTDENGVIQKVVSCGTCHTAHGRGFPYLLNISNSASAMCLECHIK